jgi:ADP-ribose pyrophosphatase YjhB (NUDIX family)
VDTAVLTVGDAPSGRPELLVLQVRRAESDWALPGTFLHSGERLMDAVLRSLREKAGVTGLQPRQLHVFDDPDRDDRGWVLSAAHVDVVPFARLAPYVSDAGGRLVPATAPGPLPYDHTQIIDLAVRHVRLRYDAAPDPHRLLGPSFTLRELRLVHEAVAGGSLQKDTFRRRMETHLVATGRMSMGTRGRPAELFRRARRVTATP